MNIFEKLIANTIISKIKGGKAMAKIIEFLKGKKSYVVLVIGAISGILQSQGIPIPEYVYYILGGLFGITYKMGQNRTEQTIKELLDQIKEAKKE